MPAQIITTDDLREFKDELLDDIKKLLKIKGQRIQAFLTTVKNEMFFEEIKDCTERLRIHEKLQKQRRNLTTATK